MTDTTPTPPEPSSTESLLAALQRLVDQCEVTLPFVVNRFAAADMRARIVEAKAVLAAQVRP